MIKDLFPLAQKKFNYPVEFEEESLLKDKYYFPPRVTIEYEHYNYGDVIVEEMDKKLHVMQHRLNNERWVTVGVGICKSPEECLNKIKKLCIKEENNG